MTYHVLGVGVGLFILILLWIAVLVTYIASIHIQSSAGTVLTVVATAVTVLLVLISRVSEVSQVDYNKVYDHLFIWRLSVVLLTAIAAFVSIGSVLWFHLLLPIQTKPIISAVS